MQMRGKHATSAIHLTHLHSLRLYPLLLNLLVKVQIGEEPVHLFLDVYFVFAVAPTERCHDISVGNGVDSPSL